MCFLMMGIERETRNWELEKDAKRQKKGKQGRWERRKRKKEPLLSGNTGPLWPWIQLSIKITVRSLSTSIFISLQIPRPFSFVLPRIIGCFWILHSSAASCLFLILFPTKEGKNELNNFLLFPLSNWYPRAFNTLPHKKTPLLAIRRVCLCHLSTWSSCLHIVSPSLYLFIYWWEQSKEKHISIIFCWRLSVLGYGLGHISLGDGWEEYVLLRLFETVCSTVCSSPLKRKLPHECI